MWGGWVSGTCLGWCCLVGVLKDELDGRADMGHEREGADANSGLGGKACGGIWHHV